MTLITLNTLMTRTTIPLRLFAVALLTVFFKPGLNFPSTLIENTSSSFQSFSQSVQNGEAHALRGVYVPNVLALPVVQQPADQPYYVSSKDGEVTQFSIASQYGNVGLLAHNQLAGKYFSQLAIGQDVSLVYGDGSVEHFVVTQVLRFQALDPESISSPFRNLDRNETITAMQMFNRAYVGEYHLVFQTCIEAYGDASWGRLFVVAVPKL